MDLMSLILLGVAAKVVLSKPKTGVPSVAPAAPVTDSKAPGYVPPMRVENGVAWGSEERFKRRLVQHEPLSADYIHDDEAAVDDAFRPHAYAVEEGSLAVGVRKESSRLAERKSRERSQARMQAICQAKNVMDFDDTGAIPATDEYVERVKYLRDKVHAADVGKDAAIEARMRAVEAQNDAAMARDEAARARRHGKDLERSIHRYVDPNLDMALRQEWKAQTGSSFVKDPNMGFVEGQPVSFREGNFDQSQVVNADEFNNQLDINSLYARGQSDWPIAVQQKSRNSDFSGVLVSEKGSPDFSHDIVYDVSDDFGG